MGTIKIELDLPDFREQLELSIVMRKDSESGKVIATTTSSSNIASRSVPKPPIINQEIEVRKPDAVIPTSMTNLSI